MTGLAELFLGLAIIGSITGLIVGVAIFQGRKEKRAEEIGESSGQGGGVRSSLSYSLQVASQGLLPTATHVEVTSSSASAIGPIKEGS